MNSIIQKKIWDDYFGEKQIDDPFLKSRYDFLFKKCKKYKNNGTVLEIGVGNGYFLKKDKEKYNVFGTDFCDSTLNKKYNFITFKSDLTKEINWQNNYFDIVVASEVLEHIDPKKTLKALNNIKKILKKGGVFIGTIPYDEDLDKYTVFCPYCMKKYHNVGHQNSFNISYFSKIIKDVGFEKIELKHKIIFTTYTKWWNYFWINKRPIYQFIRYKIFNVFSLKNKKVNCGYLYFCVKK